MRKFILFMFVALWTSVVPMFAWDYEHVLIGELYYNLDAATGAAEVTFEENATTNYAQLETTLIIPASVEYENVNYTVASIGAMAFYSCGLQSVVIPNTVNAISDGAFTDCKNLVSVSIPESVATIGKAAFSNCVKLQEVTIPNGVTVINEGTFIGCKGLTALPIGNSVITIGESAYESCTGLASIVLPGSVTKIGTSAFERCYGLTSATLPNSVVTIDNYAFYACGRLPEIFIPARVTRVGHGAFYGCDNMMAYNVDADNANFSAKDGVLFNKDQTILVMCPNGKQGVYDVPEGVIKIEPNESFHGCMYLTEINIPNSVTVLDGNAFYACGRLTDIHVAADNPALCSIDGVLFNKDQTKLIVYPANKKGAYVIPSSVTAIGSGAFEDCYGLTSVTLPNGITSIEKAVFYGCENLTEISIPTNVKTIGIQAFKYCRRLANVRIPNSVTSIGKEAFAICDSLKSITCEATTPPTCGATVFSGVNKPICRLRVPAESVEAYKTADQWKDFLNNIDSIQAQAADVDKPQAEPTDNAVVISWPTVEEATLYTIEIMNGDVRICTLIFNSSGQLLNVAWGAPARGGSFNLQMATQTEGGWQYTIDGLDPGTEYTYIVIASDGDKEIFKETNTFKTTGGTENIEFINGGTTDGKILRNGQIFILNGDKIYTVTGQEVKSHN